jgi:hypothetical protein
VVSGSPTSGCAGSPSGSGCGAPGDASNARTGFGEILSSVGRVLHRIIAPEEAADRRSDRMARMSLVVDDLAARLNPDERRVLRETGAVPEWFVPTVEATYKERYA